MVGYFQLLNLFHSHEKGSRKVDFHFSISLSLYLLATVAHPNGMAEQAEYISDPKKDECIRRMCKCACLCVMR